MGKLHKGAFAVMGMCKKAREPFGITVDPRDERGTHFAFCWGFKIKAEQAKREGYDRKSVRGSVEYDRDFNGCPHCGSKLFWLCHHCNTFVCWDGETQMVTCPKCGCGGQLQPQESVALSGGAF
ncbi:MAG: hypothetical protein LIP02_02965 [Bacteroidales bacterium]|nr:hypothetical protein [Bacteroidales bacterium]